MDLFDLLFSPSGSIGRGKWWLGQLFLFLCFIGLGFYFVFILEVSTGSTSLQQAVGYLPKIMHASGPEKSQLNALVSSNMSHVYPHFWAVMAIILVLGWSSIVIEIKRWHDLGMSGGWVLLRFVPGPSRLLFGEPVGVIISLVLYVGTLIFLGFISGSYEYTPLPGRFGAQPVRAKKSSCWVTGLTVVGILALGSILISVLVVLLGHNVAKSAPPAAPSIASTFSSASPLGTSSSNFTKDSVTVGGQTLTGISSVIPSSGYQVVIIHSGGGKTVPASYLPQGFLDAWKITPDALKAADNR